jgi:hypothetical protein
VTAAACVRCDRPALDGHACTHCGVTKPTGQLQQLADMTGAARDIAQGLSRRTTTGTTGKPGPQLPFDLGATSRLDAVQVALTAHIDHIGTIRGITRPWFADHTDPIVAAAEWLTAHGLEWMRHRDRDDVARFLTDIDTCARIVAGIARGPTAQKYLGPCGAPLVWCTCVEQGAACETHPWTRDVAPCEGDVYAREGASVGRCRTCSAEVSTADRRAWLDAEVRSHAYRAAEIANAFPEIKVNTIRSWAQRGILKSYWRTHLGIVTPWTDTDDADEIALRGPRLHYLGDVLDLAAPDAARKAGNQARRARQTTRKDAAA